MNTFLSAMNLLTDSTTPDLTPIKNLALAWGSVFLSFIAGIVALVAIVYIVKNAIALIKSDSPETRSAIIHNLVWIVIGFLLCAGSSVIFGVLSNSFFGS